MDVINFISKADGLLDAPNPSGARYVNAFQMFADGPHVHDYLAEMTREVFTARDGQYLTVGEMPGVTYEQARLYTGVDRGELNMVFQFEHVQLDQSTAHAGFTTGEPWLPVNPNHTWLNAAAQQGATDSVFAYCHQLIQLRHDRPILVDGNFTPVIDDDPHIWAYTRVTDAESLLILTNCGTDPRTVAVDDTWAGARLVLSNSPAPATIDRHKIALDSWDARIYLKPA